MPSVSRFNVTPVKGTALQHPDHIRVEPYGVPGNRRFFLIDEDGQRISATKLPSLVQVTAESSDGRLRLTFPDGHVVEDTTDPTGDELIADMWGRPVTT